METPKKQMENQRMIECLGEIEDFGIMSVYILSVKLEIGWFENTISEKRKSMWTLRIAIKFH